MDAPTALTTPDALSSSQAWRTRSAKDLETTNQHGKRARFVRTLSVHPAGTHMRAQRLCVTSHGLAALRL